MSYAVTSAVPSGVRISSCRSEPRPAAGREPRDLAVGVVEHHVVADPEPVLRLALPPGERRLAAIESRRGGSSTLAGTVGRNQTSSPVSSTIIAPRWPGPDDGPRKRRPGRAMPGLRRTTVIFGGIRSGRETNRCTSPPVPNRAQARPGRRAGCRPRARRPRRRCGTRNAAPAQHGSGSVSTVRWVDVHVVELTSQPDARYGCIGSCRRRRCAAPTDRGGDRRAPASPGSGTGHRGSGASESRRTGGGPPSRSLFLPRYSISVVLPPGDRLAAKHRREALTVLRAGPGSIPASALIVEAKSMLSTGSSFTVPFAAVQGVRTTSGTWVDSR